MGIFVIVAFVIRVIAGSLIFVISRDTTRFITMAYAVKTADADLFMAEQFHPLYPVITYLFSYIFPNWITAAKVASMVMGTACIVPLYYISRRLFGQRTAKATVFLYAIHPYAVRYSGDAISETTYVFFLLCGLWAGYCAIIAQNRWRYILSFCAGGCIAGAYLTRPEGIGLLIILTLLIWLYPVLSGHKKVLYRSFFSFLLLIIGFAVFSSPYLYFMKQQTGQWRITTKKPLRTFVPAFITRHFTDAPEQLGHIDHIPPSETHNPRPQNTIGSIIHKKINAIASVSGSFVRTTHPVLFCLMLIGIWGGWQGFNKDQKILALFIGIVTLFYLYILYRLSLHFYTSKRYMLPLTTICFAFTAKGIDILCGLRILKGKVFLKLKPYIITLILLAIVLLPKTLKPQRYNKLYIKNLAKWIIAQEDTESVYAVDDARISFYAKLNFSVFPKEYKTNEEFTTFMYVHKCRYLLAEKEFIDKYIPNIHKLAENNKIKLKSIYKNTDKQKGEVKYCLYEYFH